MSVLVPICSFCSSLDGFFDQADQRTVVDKLRQVGYFYFKMHLSPQKLTFWRRRAQKRILAIFGCDDEVKLQRISVNAFSRKGDSGFSIVELMLVIAVLATMMAMVSPAMKGMKGAGDITKAAYDVGGVLEAARAYATANNTYVWVGFFEENAEKASATPAIEGIGRIVLSAMASRDGTPVIDPNNLSANVTQISKLVKIENTHLKTASSSDKIFPVGSGTGASFDGRPTVSAPSAQIGDTTPDIAQTSFRYPLGGSMVAQYTFTKFIQFSPRGEVVVNNTYPIKPVMEIGLQPTRGTLVDTANRNVAAVQISGMLGNVKIYRR